MVQIDLFGTKQDIEAKSGQTVLKEDHGKINDQPISLTPEEMKDLESMVLEASTDNDRLSKDSILYDLKFTVLSFKVDLMIFDHQPLLSLAVEPGLVRMGASVSLAGPDHAGWRHRLSAVGADAAGAGNAQWNALAIIRCSVDAHKTALDDEDSSV